MVAFAEGTPTMREDMVRVGMGTADIRYRGEYRTWRVKLQIRYNANMISRSSSPTSSMSPALPSA
jgi:hypothetical protein